MDEMAQDIAILSAQALCRDMASDARRYTVVDARSREEFGRGHIPGATWMGWEEWCDAAPAHGGAQLTRAGYWGVLADLPMQVWAERLSARGLSSDRPLVVYADGAPSMGREGRIAWMLLYLGARTVQLLDRGWSGWLASGGRAAVGTSIPPRGGFTVALQERRRARLHDLKAAYGAGALPLPLDTRARADFDGEVHDYLPRKGRLPGAILVPYADLFDDAGAYVPRERYVAQMPEELRAAPALVAYCEVGVRASTVALLHEIYTGQFVPVFDGSLMQWGLDAELPIFNNYTSSAEIPAPVS
jgi:thiosulfate/3-mercaptopyruvate sulfurtransferase